MVTYKRRRSSKAFENKKVQLVKTLDMSIKYCESLAEMQRKKGASYPGTANKWVCFDLSDLKKRAEALNE